MKFQYTPVFSISGVNLSPDEVEKELIVDSSVPFRAFLTTRPDLHLSEGDRSLAVAGLILRAIFRHDPSSDEFKQLVKSAVEEVRSQRQKEGGKHPFLVIVAGGEVDLTEPRHIREAEDFIVWFDGIDKEKIRTGFGLQINAVMTSIFSSVKNVVGIKKLGDAVVFFREDNKPVYSYTLTPGSVRAYISRILTEDQARNISQLYPALVQDRSLQRVHQLIRSSYETRDDPLRSFIAAWSAIEIFINKVFSQYEAAFFNSMLEENHPDAQQKYLTRIRDVMKDKYRLGDKFAAISFSVAPDSADQDLQTFTEIKAVRNDLFHGRIIDEDTLPVEKVQNLVNKYIRLHFANT